MPVRERRGQRRLRLTLGVHGVPSLLGAVAHARAGDRPVPRRQRRLGRGGPGRLAAARGHARPGARRGRRERARPAPTGARAGRRARRAPRRRARREPGRIRIGDPRSRWGSASSTGTLSFSFRLSSPRPGCSTTSSATRSRTCASRTTRELSGPSSTACARGGSRRSGCASTVPRCTPGAARASGGSGDGSARPRARSRPSPEACRHPDGRARPIGARPRGEPPRPRPLRGRRAT